MLQEWLDEISTIQDLGPLVEETDPPRPATDPPVVATEPPVTETPPPVVVVSTEPPAATSPPAVTEPPTVATDPPVVSTETPATVPPLVATEPPFSPTDPPIFTNVLISIQELSQHNLSGLDCWVAYYDKVYDLTTYVHPDPPGNSVISCGINGTAAFASVHDKEYLDFVKDLVVGQLEVVTDSPTVEPTTGATGDGDDNGDTEVPTEVPTESDGFISIEQLSQHNSPGLDCWVAYYGTVYDLTTYVHPDPPGNSIISCGFDGTAAFASVHDKEYLDFVEDLVVGELDPETVFEEQTTQPQELTVMSLEELAQHNSTNDCWVAYYQDVYDLTTYVHPGKYGMSVIYMSCGQDGTRNYTAVHPRDYLEDVEHMKVGWLESSSVTTKGVGFAIVLASLVHSIHLGM